MDVNSYYGRKNTQHISRVQTTLLLKFCLKLLYNDGLVLWAVYLKAELKATLQNLINIFITCESLSFFKWMQYNTDKNCEIPGGKGINFNLITYV